MRCRADVIPMNAKPDTMPMTATVMSSCVSEKPAWVLDVLRRLNLILAIITPPRGLKGRQNFPRPIEQRPCRRSSPANQQVCAGVFAQPVTDGDAERKRAS